MRDTNTEEYKWRQNKKKRKLRNRRIRRLVSLGVLVFLLVVVLMGFRWFKTATGMTISEGQEYARETIEASTEDTFELNKKSTLYYSDGSEMAVLSSGDTTTYLEYEDIPAYVVNAFISVEDRDFWNNPGYDAKAIIRAALSYMTSDSISQGGSTITQQLCKLTFLSSEKTVGRKAKEIFLAAELTRKYSKEQIIEWYVNSVCFANGIYGIEDAAQAYFGKSTEELSLAETAYLCVIPNRPEYYDPWGDPENALERQGKILSGMLECGYITQDEYNEAVSETLVVTSGPSEDDDVYNYATSYAIHCAAEVIMEQSGFDFENDFSSNSEYEEYQDSYEEAYAEAKNALYTNGYEVYTSIDPDSQEEIQSVLDEELDFNTETDDDGIYNLQGAVTAIDNETGKVVAIVGGRTQEDTDSVYGYNRAYQYTRQPGSSIKPLIAYIPALESGYSATTKIKDVDVQKAYNTYKDGGDVTALSGTSYTLRYSVEHSLNGAALYVYSDITPAVGMEYLLNMGFANIVPDDYYLSAALGGFTHGTNTVEMANAYSTISNYGEYRNTDCILSMLDVSGEEIYDDPDAVEVYESNACIEITDIMEGVLTSGTASDIKWDSYTDEPAAGKTGTTDEMVDGWFVGYTNDYTIAVWVGSDDNTSVYNLYGGTYPARIWRDSMLWLLENKETGKENSIFEATEEADDSGDYEIWHTNQAAFVRSGPGTEYGVVYTLNANTDVIMVEQGDYWSEIEVDGTTCYIYTPFLSMGSVENH